MLKYTESPQHDTVPFISVIYVNIKSCSEKNTLWAPFKRTSVEQILALF